ncbi:MAG: hypothetical protein ACQGVC_18305 [Myxococcota bacterium]
MKLRPFLCLVLLLVSLGASAAERFPNHVRETTTTAGTGDRMLDGAASDFLAFDASTNGDPLVDGDTVKAGIYEASGATVNWEWGLYTFRDNAPGRRLVPTDIRKSSNGGAAVSFTAGTRIVEAVTSGDQWEDLLSDALGNGILVKTADGPDLVARTIQGDTKLPVSNGSGVSGDPTLDDSWIDAHVLDRDSGAAEADRTMAGRLVHGAGEEVITPDSGVFERWGDDAGTDLADRMVRSGSGDWRHDIREGGAWKRNVTVVAGAGGADAGKLVHLDSSGADFTKGPSLSGKARQTLRVDAAETGYEFGGRAVEDSIVRITSDQASVSTGDETLITALSNIPIPGGPGDGIRRVLVRVYFSVDPSSGAPWNMVLRLRMGTNGNITDAIAWTSATKTVNSGSLFAWNLEAYAVVPANATALSVTLQRTGGSGTWQAKGYNPSDATLFDLTASSGSTPNPPAGFVHVRSLGQPVF